MEALLLAQPALLAVTIAMKPYVSTASLTISSVDQAAFNAQLTLSQPQTLLVALTVRWAAAVAILLMLLLA